jgi:hypothetical protein
MQIKRNKVKKIALALSLCALIIWGVLGTGASLAWFTEETPVVKNIFQTAEFDLKVEYLNEQGEWASIESATDVFDKEALYEPGYMQIVYLKIANKGTVDFDYQTVVNVYSYTEGINIFGRFNLQDYLRFGMVEDTTFDGLKAKVDAREEAIAVGEVALNNYNNKQTLAKNSEVYAALVVNMPKSVGNVANYSIQQPTVELGITVKATQK